MTKKLKIKYVIFYSLKASFEAINLGIQTHEFAIGRDLVGLSGNVGPEGLLGAPSTPIGPQKRKKSHSRTPSATIVAPPPPLLVNLKYQYKRA
jgi:hypothetical protein